MNRLPFACFGVDDLKHCHACSLSCGACHACSLSQGACHACSLSQGACSVHYFVSVV